MKTLTLLRHAKSQWDDTVPRDFDRPLNAKGARAARTVGRHMREAGMAFDRVIASPAVRVVQTLDGVWDGLGRPMTPVWDKRIYLASAATLCDLVRETADDVGSLLLAGHNPGLEDLVLLLVPDRPEDRLRDDVEEKFPTASLAELQFAVDRWADIDAGGGVLARFVRPRDLDPALGPGRE
ncbi:SixA phosphatase family protein [Sphingomonas flavalba]|uniref:SixA phosphatase family protein n=1 Tax=Sphingomonas flavalba TaxID=2559804 RepID=UPI0039E08385